MADTKITALAAITTVDPANDVLPIVDVSNNSMAASGTTCRVTTNQLLQANAIASLASATITGDLTVRTNKLAVTSTGVGCGTTTPALPFVVSNAGAQGFEINPNGSIVSGGIDILSYNRSTSLYKGAGFAAESYLFRVGTVSATDAMTLNSTGLNIANGNVILGTSGKGIDFSATASGSGTMTSELLSDYEEGTFTGTLKGSVSDPTTTVTTTGRYTKIGRVVTVQIEFNNVSTVGASGNASVIGLPFTNSNAGGCVGGVISFSGLTFTETLSCIVGGVSSTVDIYSVKSNSSWVAATHNAGTGRYLWINVTYTV